MTSEAQRIAIAEACGWKKEVEHVHVTTLFPEAIPQEVWKKDGRKDNLLGLPPNYLSDLNAMHEAEKVMTEDDQKVFIHILCELTGTHTYSRIFGPVFATAAQRAEAFLRTLGKWEGMSQ